MRRSVLALVVAGVMSAAAWGADVSQEIMKLEKERTDAFATSNVTEVGKFFADDATYIHASGALETKKEFLEKMQSGARKYASVQDEGDVTVRPYGDVVILTGSSKVTVTTDGKTQNLHLRFTEAWAKRGGKWQVVSYQSTRIPE